MRLFVMTLGEVEVEVEVKVKGSVRRVIVEGREDCRGRT